VGNTNDAALVQDNNAIGLAAELSVVSSKNEGPLTAEGGIDQMSEDGIRNVRVHRGEHVIEEDNLTVRVKRPKNMISNA